MLRSIYDFFVPPPGLVWPTKDLLARSGLVGCALFLLSWLASLPFGVETSALEVTAVILQYSCTYLCVIQSRWNYPVGAVSVALFSVLFFQSDLLASAALNVYLIPVLLYGWWRWGDDLRTRRVTHLNAWMIPVYVAVTAVVWVVCATIVGALGGELRWQDTGILVLSVLAQLLLDNKKIETWIIWVMVNVLAIYVYFSDGLFFVGVQFIFLLANTLFGWWSWHRSMKHDRIVRSSYYGAKSAQSFVDATPGMHPAAREALDAEQDPHYGTADGFDEYMRRIRAAEQKGDL